MVLRKKTKVNKIKAMIYLFFCDVVEGECFVPLRFTSRLSYRRPETLTGTVKNKNVADSHFYFVFFLNETVSSNLVKPVVQDSSSTTNVSVVYWILQLEIRSGDLGFKSHFCQNVNF